MTDMSNRFDTLIVGMGASALKCADELLRMGRKSVGILVDDALDGTSRNAGSDKQTYYKLTLSGNGGDSVHEMAETFYSGGCVDGPNALTEAALSAACFLRLCELGVQFPMNRYGEYIGYRTDHDPRNRATSAGPLTSKQMTEALEKNVREKGACFIEKRMAIRIVVRDNQAKGVICIHTETNELEVYSANHIVWATGGPASIYQNVSYPVRHTGMSGAPILAGAAACNVTEWQYGLGSISPKWNVSGTYMQALPRFVSTDKDGNDGRDFLLPYFENESDMLLSIFLKGYQWPFDARKAEKGSSRIDLAVQGEIQKGRRVFLDFLNNPVPGLIDFSSLNAEAYSYLEKAGAFLDTPIQRLAHMNQPAIDFYMSKGVDLHTEKLEIALCAQHMNGGIMVNEWWESEIKSLFVIGECAGTHGVYRPGGSALNAGQVGGARSARKISFSKERLPDPVNADGEISELAGIIEKCMSGKSNLSELAFEESSLMSKYAGAIREKSEIDALIQRNTRLLQHFTEYVHISSKKEIPGLFRFFDTLVSRLTVASGIKEYIKSSGVNRGSSVYTENGAPDSFSDTDPYFDSIQEIRLKDGVFHTSIRNRLPIPSQDDFFENVWREFRQGKW